MIGEAAALGSAVTWAVTSIIMAALSRHVAAVPLSALRAACGGLFFLVALVPVFLFADVGDLTMGRAVSLAASGVTAMAIGDTLYVSSLARIGAARTIPITSSFYPLLTFGLAFLLLDEAFGWQTALGSVMIVTGIVLIATPSGQQAVPVAGAERGVGIATRVELRLGVALALISAVVWALATIWLRVAAPEGVNPIVAGALRLPTAAAVLLLLSLRRPGGLDLKAFGRRGLLLIFLGGFAGSGIGSLLYIVGVQIAGAGRGAVLASTTPLFALPLAVLFLAERPNAQVVAGTLLAMAGIFLVV